MSSPESPPSRENQSHLIRKLTIAILPVGFVPVILLGLMLSVLIKFEDSSTNSDLLRIAISSIITAAFLAWLVSWLVAKKLSIPLIRLSQAMEIFLNGNWDQRAAVPPKDDIARVAELFNQIADEYRSTYQSLTLREAGGRAGNDQGMHQIARIVVEARSQAEMLEGTLETLVRGFGLTYASVYFIEQDQLREKRFAVRLHSFQLPGYVASNLEQTQRPERVDLDSIPTLEWQVSKAIATRQAEIAESDQEVGLFEAAIPLMRAGLIIGVLDLLAFSRSGDTRLGPFGARGLVELQKAAGLIALGLSDLLHFDSESLKKGRAEGNKAFDTDSEATEEVAAKAQTQRQLAELRTFWNISRAISVESDLTPLFEMIHRQLEEVMGELNSFTIALYEPANDKGSEGTIRIPFSIEDGRRLRYEPFSLDEGLTSIVVRTGKPLLIAKDVEEKSLQLGAKVFGIPAKSWLGAPMIYSGEVIGVIVVQDIRVENRFNDDDQRMLSALAVQAAVVVRNAHLLEVARRQARQEKLTNEITARVRRASDIQTILKTTVHELGVALGARRACIQLSTEFPEQHAEMEAEL